MPAPKRPFFFLQFGQAQRTHLKEELFVLKATRVFPIPTQAEQTEDGEHFANGEQ